MSFTINELITSNPKNNALDSLGIDFCLPFDLNDNLLLDSPADSKVLFGSFSLPDSTLERCVDSFTVIPFPSQRFDDNIKPLLSKSPVGSAILSDLPQSASILIIITSNS